MLKQGPIVASSNDSANRYARQQQFLPIGKDGQHRISAARVAVLGCGALGSVAGEILARAGVGHLRLIDRDVVEWTNLQRQSLYDEQDAMEARSKAEAAAERLAQINSKISIDPVVVDVSCDNICDVLCDMHLVIDATDNFNLRFLLNDWSLATQTAWVHGGCVGASGQVRLFTGLGHPCFRCLVPEPPPASVVATCDTAGVIGGATHAIASLQSIEAMKWISGNRDCVRPTVFSIDFWNNRVREITIDSSLSDICVACHDKKREFLDGERGRPSDAVVLCGRDTVQIDLGRTGIELDLQMFADRWAALGRVQTTRFFSRLFVDDTVSLTLFRDGRVLVSGTSDLSTARSVYDRFVGS